MSLTRIFISHAGPDSAIATNLAQHLKNAGHETTVDTLDLDLGANAITFMDDGIAEAAAVVILLSKYTADAKWQKLEMHAALWNEVTSDTGKCIVLRLDDAPMPATLGPKVYARLDRDDPESLKNAVEKICRTLAAAPSASSVVAHAFGPDSRNPFRHLRAEFFENQPELHAKTFAPPDATKLGALEAMKPCILEGSRGTGKSMLLLSLRARNFLVRNPAAKARPPRFGFYLKLTRGAICNAGARLEDEHLDPTIDIGVLTDVASQELILQVTESLLSELAYCVTHALVDAHGVVERRLCEGMHDLLFDVRANDHIVSFAELQDKLSDTHKRLAEYIRRRFIYGETVSVPIATLDFEQAKRIIGLVRHHIPALQQTTFVALLDEYENLLPYQRKIVNTLLKLGPPHISVKIAKKLASGDVPATTTGQELQEIHDYTRVPLVYNLDEPPERRAYEELLRSMASNMISLERTQSLDMDVLLPRFTSPEVDRSLCLAQVAQLTKMTVPEFRSLPKAKQREKITYYGHAAVYRVLLGKPGRHREKRFAGFSDLALLGSGVIRYFQEFLSVGYHLTYGSTPPAESDHLTVPASEQSRAVHIVSRHNLTTLSRNVERYGEDLKYFLLDLGDCLRHKLLRHTSEPEAARLTIENPEKLNDVATEALRRILAIGEREGVFQTKEGLPAFKPKHGSDPQPTEFNVCRVYAPVLQVSPRLRWRTTVKCEHLQALLEPDRRPRAVRRLKDIVVKATIGDQPLFDQGRVK